MSSRTEKCRTWTIGNVAKAASVNVETIRHYQRQKLLVEPVKPLNGFRVYPSATIDRIRFIKRAQKLGFSLNEIGQLLGLGNHHCSKVQALAEEKRSAVQSQIDGLISIKQALDEMIMSCEKGVDTDDCAFMKSLSIKDLSNK